MRGCIIVCVLQHVFARMHVFNAATAATERAVSHCQTGLYIQMFRLMSLSPLKDNPFSTPTASSVSFTAAGSPCIRDHARHRCC